MRRGAGMGFIVRDRGQMGLLEEGVGGAEAQEMDVILFVNQFGMQDRGFPRRFAASSLRSMGRVCAVFLVTRLLEPGLLCGPIG